MVLYSAFFHWLVLEMDLLFQSFPHGAITRQRSRSSPQAMCGRARSYRRTLQALFCCSISPGRRYTSHTHCVVTCLHAGPPSVASCMMGEGGRSMKNKFSVYACA